MPVKYVTVNQLVQQLSSGSSNITTTFATVNRTQAAVVTPGSPVPFTSVGASRYLFSGVGLTNGTTFIFPDGVYMIENISFPGNSNLDYRVLVNGSDISGLVTGGSIYQDRFSAANGGMSTMQIVNAGSSNITLAGTDGGAFVSFTQSKSG